MSITYTVTFDDPAEIAQDVRSIPGREFLQRLVDQRARVPIGATLGYWLTELGDGVAVFEGDPGPQTYNPLGGVQGGWYASILDAALGCCLHTTLPAGVGYTTIELKLNIVRAIKPGRGVLRATGRIVHRGRRTAVTEARLEDAAGKLYAHATATQLVIEDGPGAAD